MRVLVTGGAGFIGSHVADAFLARGDEVAVVDDLSAGSAARLDEHVVLHKQSIVDGPQLAALVEEVRPELICHLAAQIDVRASVVCPARDAQANVIGTVNVLEAARQVGARLVFCSTGGAIYGREAPIPCPETVVPLPESPYGIAKFCAEQYVGLYNRLHGATHAVLRFANVYGPRQDPTGEAGVIAIFCSRALDGNGADHLRRRHPDPRLRVCRRRGRGRARRGGQWQARRLERRDRDRDQRSRPDRAHRPGRGAVHRAGVRPVPGG